MTKADTERINRAIHERLMGKCWHDGMGVCPNYRYHTRENIPANITDLSDWCGHPDYTSDKSERRLLDEAIEKCLEVCDVNAFDRTLVFAMKAEGVKFWEQPLFATPLQIATAIFNCLEAENQK